jgi:hypothetical protein
MLKNTEKEKNKDKNKDKKMCIIVDYNSVSLHFNLDKKRNFSENWVYCLTEGS